MKTAYFYNFTKEPYTGYWDGKPRTIKPGEKRLMEEFLARHFALGLANRVLLERKPGSNETVIPGGENYTSPKFPEQVPQFMEQFNKAFLSNEDSNEEDEVGVQDQLLNQKPQPKVHTSVDNQPPQVIPGDDDDFEEIGGQSSK